MTKVRTVSMSVLLTAVVALTPAAAQWVQFVDDSAARMSAASSLGLGDNREKDYAWGDVDKDGDIDLVNVRKQPFTSPGKNTNVLFLNQGGVLTDRTEDFATDSSVAGDQGFKTATNDRDVILTDVNLDGWLDIVTATTISDGDPKYIGHPRIYMNKGCAVGGGTAASSCTTANWLGYKYEEPRIPAMLTKSGGSGFNPRFCAVAAGDLTGDGYPELWFGDYDASGAGGSGEPAGADFDDKLLLNQGAANPGFFTDVTGSRFSGIVPGEGQAFPVSAFGAAAEIRDMNGDGWPDIVKQTGLNSPTYTGQAYNQPGTPGFFTTYQSVGPTAPYFVSVNDLNQDNKLDLVITDDGADRYLLNNGGGFVPGFTSFPFSFDNLSSPVDNPADDGFGSQSVISDLNKDGWPDVVIVGEDVDIGPCSGRRMHIYKNLGGTPGGNVILQEQVSGSSCQVFQGNPSTCIVAGIPSNKLEGVHNVAVFDLNGDTWKDLVVGRCNSTEIYLNVPPGPAVGAIDASDASKQLVIGKFGNQLSFDWGASCNSGDTDYGIYEGRLLAPFDQHIKKQCSTGGITAALIAPPADDVYYLIVPNTQLLEGGYGVASNGLPRGPGVSSCFPQYVGSCQ